MRRPQRGHPEGGQAPHRRPVRHHRGTTHRRAARIAVTIKDPKSDLREYLQRAREALVWKLDGLSEYDIRRPLVPTGTNLLGLIKHKAHSEFVYFGATFGRPPAEPPSWLQDDAEPNADKWARADEPREEIVELYRRAWAHSDATIDALALDAVGQVPHWPVG